ncbi:trafficking protein particle complex subunit 6b-like [Xenia sp. Carnegie-2017]|uniref:trafficking protein particle complex subunit 6b-like n=1 Tax=Xenia sp. Carnegie-2017 TaxID=2897299 RepID=UPI001F043024|nr:trafficking protein particle complex subunit 6b-like [Xenia sp. Carnegie-2017]
MAETDSVFEFLHMQIVDYIKEVHGKENENHATSVLEHIGFTVGQRLAERFTKETARFKDDLDVMKYICKDFWTALYKKQIDNLRTNHQGVFVLQDNRFALLTQISEGEDDNHPATQYLSLPCGLIRGALANLGIQSIVVPEITTMPMCKFTIKIEK